MPPSAEAGRGRAMRHGHDPRAVSEARAKLMERTVAALRAAWWAHPELRLGQLIGNCAPPGHTDAYYVADGEMCTALERTRDAELP